MIYPPFEQKTIDALRWLLGILDKNKIPYRIGGGFAAHVYGSEREVKDIDVSISGIYFPIIMKEASEYITSEPKHYIDAKWDCDALSIKYNGQKIDMTDIDTLRMSNKEKTQWLQTKDEFRKFPNFIINVDGMNVSLIDSRDLLAYKKHLVEEGHEHHNIDIKAIEEYIKEVYKTNPGDWMLISLIHAQEYFDFLCTFRKKYRDDQIQSSKELNTIHRAVWTSLIAEIRKLFDDSRYPNHSLRNSEFFKEELNKSLINTIYGNKILQKIITTANTFTLHLAEEKTKILSVSEICDSNLGDLLKKLEDPIRKFSQRN